MTFAERIKMICKDKGVRVSHLEKACGFGNGYILTLKDTMPRDRAEKVADYLGVTVDTIMHPTKKDLAKQSPTVEKIVLKVSSLSEAEQKEVLSFAEYILSKR